MDYLRIEIDDKERWDKVWELYEKAFLMQNVEKE